MFISEIKIESFRLFGSGDDAFVLSLNPGLTALVGDNDAVKTAIIDAMRFVLHTTDQEFVQLEPTDFYQPPNGQKCADHISIRCKFEGLLPEDRGAFAESLARISSVPKMARPIFATTRRGNPNAAENVLGARPFSWRGTRAGPHVACIEVRRRS